ncbi:MAG: lysophospholipid acyltransferase family protein [Gammaproteobacteria bacterium]|nr:lysophospholipid acyltransferase family protein [Gammaproteobacteria bacterium]
MSTRTDRIAETVLRTNARLPLSVLHTIGNIFGSLLLILPGKRVATCRTNIESCFPELSRNSQRRLVRQSLRQISKGLMEVGRLWLQPAEKNLAMIKSVSGEEHITKCLEEGRGVILAAPHMGSWELAGSYVSSRYPLTTMYQKPPLKGLSKLIKDGREGSGGNYVPADNSGIRAMLKALRKGEMVGLLPDQVPSQGGVIAPFFDKPALTISLLSKLSGETDATVIFVFAERLPWSRGFKIQFLPPDELISSTALEESAARINAQVEKCIRMAPDQYLWVYKRFQKNGEHFYDR